MLIKKIFLAIFMLGVSQLFAYNVVSFAPSQFNTNTQLMDQSLGLVGYTIEDFEDVNLVEGLTLEMVNPDLAPTSVLPQVYNPVHANNQWDGSRALVNHNQQIFTTNPPLSQITTFHIEDGATSVGIGLANFQNLTNHQLLINGQVVADISTLPGFAFGVSARNLYIRVDAEGGDALISSFSIDEQFSNADGLVFDHVAFLDNAVPEPSSFIMFAFGAIFFLGKRKK